MGAGRKTQTITVSEWFPSSSTTVNTSAIAKNLNTCNLGGVIFGCKHSTMEECLSKQLFGLPFAHFSYVQNIKPGLPLFLFNYSDRKLHGIYEAVSHGQMNIDPYAWTDGGAERSPFPAQVHIRIKTQCHPLPENQFRKVIEDNYYISQHFWFELDHAQTHALIALFKPLPVKSMLKLPPVMISSSAKPSVTHVASSWTDLFKAVPSTTLKSTNDQECENSKGVGSKKGTESSSDLADEDELVSHHLDDKDTEHCSLSKTSSSAPGDTEPVEEVSDWEDLVEDNAPITISDGRLHLDGDDHTTQKKQCGDEALDLNVELVVHKLKNLSANHRVLSPSSQVGINGSAFSTLQGHGEMLENDRYFSEEPHIFSKKGTSVVSHLYHGDEEFIELIKELRERTANLEKRQVESDQEIKSLRNQVRDLKDHVRYLELKNDPSVALDDSLNKFVEQCLGSEDVIYLIGGFNGSSWLSALDSFSPSLDILTPLKPMSCARSYASAVTLNGNLYVFGGGDGSSWFDSVECYNPRRDEWTLCPKMVREKGSLAGATLNNKIYAIGGGNGMECFSDVEMFDPVLGRWLSNQTMLHKRFAPAAAELGGVLYTVGGYDGKYYLQSAERFDPREPYWSMLPSMKVRRGCHSLVVYKEKLYAVGGYDGDNMVSSVEVFDPRLGSWMTGEPLNSVRGYAAAVVNGDNLFVIGGVKDGENIVDTVECYKEGSGWVDSGLKAVGRRCFCSALVL